MNLYTQFIENATPVQVAAYVSVFVPLLVELLTKINVNSKVKAILNLVLTALAANIGLLVVQGTNDWNWNEFLSAWVVAAVTSIVSYLGLWKPTKVAEKVDNAKSNIGISAGQEAPAGDLVEEDDVIALPQPGDEVEEDGEIASDGTLIDTADVNGRVPGDPDPGPDAVPGDEPVDPTAGSQDEG
jgi:hypothetical protein